MINSKQRYNPNALGNAIVSDDGKIDFFLLQNCLKTGVFQQVPLFAYLSKRLQLWYVHFVLNLGWLMIYWKKDIYMFV